MGCTEKHEWNKCHMFGLGIYLADLSQKSHRYCSQPEVTANRKRRYRMVVCSVLGRAFTVEGHLRHASAMHDVVSVRSLQKDELGEMIEPCCSPCNLESVYSSCPCNLEGVRNSSRTSEVAEKSDLLF